MNDECNLGMEIKHLPTSHRKNIRMVEPMPTVGRQIKVVLQERLINTFSTRRFLFTLNLVYYPKKIQAIACILLLLYVYQREEFCSIPLKFIIRSLSKFNEINLIGIFFNYQK